MTDALLWPRYDGPADLAAIEAVPLKGRGLPKSTCALLARAAVLSPDIWDTARELAGAGLLDALLVLRPTGATGATGSPESLPDIDGVRVSYLNQLAAGQPSTFDGAAPESADLAAFFHTGGTTGAPKLAAHTHANEVADAWMIAANSLLDAESVIFAALPLFHVNALVATVLAPLFKGQQVVWAGPLGYREPALYGEFWKIVDHYRIAAMSAVPTVYAVLAQCPVDADISSLCFALVGASPLPAAVRASFQAHTGITLVEGYGLTEATCASARSFPGTPRPDSVGQRFPYQHVKIVRPGTGEEVPPGETGVLAISGPTVFAGYVTGHNGDGHLLDGLGTLADGWLHTGDLARVDDDGFIHLAGRAKDLIIRGGHNIDPAVIEDALLSHPQVTAAGAVGRPDVHAGEVPVAYVTLAPGATVTEEELRAWAAEHVPERAAAPKAVTVLDALPVTEVVKPYKLALRADAAVKELTEALRGIAGIHGVDVEIDDGSIVATATIEADADPAAVKAALDQYTIRWIVAVLP